MQVYVFSQILWISCLLADFEKLFYAIIIKISGLSTAIADFEIQNRRLWDAKPQTLRNIGFYNMLILKAKKAKKSALTYNLFLTFKPRNITGLSTPHSDQNKKHPLGYADY